MRPRIGIDAHMAGSRETGNETYVLNLLRTLPKVDAERRFEYEATVLAAGMTLRSLVQETNTRIVRVRPALSLVRIPASMPLVAMRDRLSLLHMTYVVPPLCPCPTVVTVHDIAFRLHPDYFPPRLRLMLSMLVPFSMRRADRVITVSNSARQDILDHYDIPADRVVVTHEAAAPQYRVLADSELLEGVKARYQIHKDFLLAVGNLQPRKNLHRLVQAYGQLPDSVRGRYLLVIAGQALWQHSAVFEVVSERGLQSDVLFTGYVPDEDLVALYNAASLFLYPSLYEGFGLPVLEAMACGTPVVTSSVSSLPEVAGDAALLVDPQDVSQLASAIEAILSNPDLARRLSERGLRRASLFSWERTALETLEVYAGILGGG